MKTINISVGISDFEKIRKNKYYYMDKSGLIRKIVEPTPAEVTLITRPRRFGKTLGMSMLASFFDVCRDSEEIFAGLDIMKDSALCQQWMNQWPVIFLPMKDIDGLSYRKAYEQFVLQISELYKRYTYVLECEAIDPDDKELFLLLKAGQASEAQISRSLSTLMRDIQIDSEAKPTGYWKNTSDNAIIRSFIDFAGGTIIKKLETLLSGGYIVQQIDENLTYDYLHSSEENLWSVLYLTGYLTCVKKADAQEMQIPDGYTALTIPNKEIQEIFETTIAKWFDESAKTWNRQVLFEAVWNGDADTITQEMNKLLRKTISYHDYREDFYHAFLAGIFAGAGYMVESNREHGEGRSDVVVYDATNGNVAVFEAKYSKKLEAMKADCDVALCQIDSRMYTSEFEDEYDHIFCYGISFFKKRCIVKEK